MFAPAPDDRGLLFAECTLFHHNAIGLPRDLAAREGMCLVRWSLLLF